MKKLSLLILLIGFYNLISCHSEKFLKTHTVVYYSSCYLQGLPETKITLMKDFTFFYQKSPFYEDKIYGNWKKNRDTLFLYSERFNESFDDDGLGFGSFQIFLQATNTVKNHDLFLVRRNKIIPINDDGKVICLFTK